MPKTDQRASVRPIAFALHDTVRNKPQEIFQLNIRPEDLTRNEPSRMSVQQTLGGKDGGGWLDDWGPGVASVTIAGTTGWGASNVSYDGFEQFQKLHETVFGQYHLLRRQVAEEGKDPNGILLIFSDMLDGFTWHVAPQNFVLKRNRARPLLSQYQIQLIRLGDGVLEKPGTKAPGKSLLSQLGLASLESSLDKITAFANNIRGGIASALGPLKGGIEAMVKLTHKALMAVRAIAKTGVDALRSIAAPVLEIATALTKMAANVFQIVSTTRGIPQAIKAQFMGVKSAFQNAFCLLRNAFKVGGFLPQYAGLYGASNCSSTSGGRGISPFVNTNVFPLIDPAGTTPVAVTSTAQEALSKVSALDPLRPITNAELGGLVSAVNNGVAISQPAVDKAIQAATTSLNQGASYGYV